MMWGDDWGSWILGFVMMVLFWGGLIVVVVLALRGWSASDGRGGPDARRPDAHEILEERFARGEISEDEFEQRRRVLDHVAH